MSLELFNISLQPYAVLGTLLLLPIFYFLRKGFVEWMMLPKINPESMPFTIDMFMKGLIPDFLIEKSRTLGKVFRLNMPQLSYFIVVGDPELARKIFDEEVEKTFHYKVFDLVTGNRSTIFTKKTEGEEWEMNRKGISNSFSVTNLHKSLPLLHKKCDELKGIFCRLSHKGEAFEITDLFLSMTIDFIGIAMFGADFRCLSDDENSFGKILLRELAICSKEYALKQGFNPFRQWMVWDKEIQRGASAARTVMAAQKKILDDYRASHSPEVLAQDPSILAHLIRCPFQSEQERCGDMVIHMLAGHDTTAYSLSWILLELSRHPSVQIRVREEMKAVIPSDVQYIQPAHLAELKYLDCAMKEGMRLWPVAALGSFRLASKDIPYKKMIIPKGSTIMLPSYLIFRTADIKDPEKFLPERWLEDDPFGEKEKLKELFFPFALGKRNCVGQNLAKMELKLVLATLLRAFRFELQMGAEEEVVRDYFLTLKPSQAFFKVFEILDN